MACPHVATCPLFPKFSSQSTLNIWKLYFCEGEHAKCARFQASCANQPVAITLLPNGTHLAVK